MYRNPSFQQEPKDSQLQAYSILTIFLMNACLMIAWTVLDNAHQVRVTSLKQDPSTYYSTCSGFESITGKLFFTLVICLNTLIIALMVIMSTIASSVTTDYRESKFLRFSIYNIMFLVISIPPLFFFTQSSMQLVIRYLILSITGILILCFILGVLLVPKILYIRKAELGHDDADNDNDEGDKPDSKGSKDPLAYLNIGTMQ